MRKKSSPPRKTHHDPPLNTPQHLIRTRRLELGLTMEALAEILQSSVALVSYWESGLRVPGPAKVVQLAKVLKVRPVELMQPAPEGKGSGRHWNGHGARLLKRIEADLRQLDPTNAQMEMLFRAWGRALVEVRQGSEELDHLESPRETRLRQAKERRLRQSRCVLD